MAKELAAQAARLAAPQRDAQQADGEQPSRAQLAAMLRAWKAAPALDVRRLARLDTLLRSELSDQ